MSSESTEEVLASLVIPPTDEDKTGEETKGQSPTEAPTTTANRGGRGRRGRRRGRGRRGGKNYHKDISDDKEHHDEWVIRVSNNVPMNRFVHVSKNVLHKHETIELHAFGNAICTAVMASENLMR